MIYYSQLFLTLLQADQNVKRIVNHQSKKTITFINQGYSIILSIKMEYWLSEIADNFKW